MHEFLKFSELHLNQLGLQNLFKNFPSFMCEMQEARSGNFNSGSKAFDFFPLLQGPAKYLIWAITKDIGPPELLTNRD